jgi:hypothetical protein
MYIPNIRRIIGLGSRVDKPITQAMNDRNRI